ncbi:MAG: porin [Gammaproteobacteria bacterium HGW-Gammaproteobacteria-3]|nr:MAG: porin [Gammaproteobacteria bacterium HGW-Gammaproteobacteria-3]
MTLELYVDPANGQVYTTPGENRINLGRFRKESENAPSAAKLAAMEQRLAAKEKELDSKLTQLGNKVEAQELTLEQSEQKQAKANRQEKWYDKIRVRGYTQVRYNQILSGDRRADSGESRLRSVHDRSIGDDNSFSLRRIRLVFQGDLNDYVSFYLQPDFASGISNQSNNERRENFVQLRDAYADIFFDKAHEYRLRVGQSKVPFGWENLQSSQNRIALDRADAVNAAVPSERDLGVVAYYTPTHVQEIWSRLKNDKQKLFGNYGAVGVGVFNGQGVNRTEKNDEFMYAGMVTYPLELDALGEIFKGQVIEAGVSAMHNRVNVEQSSGGTTAEEFSEDRIGFHVVKYPQPFGFQTEWSWGKGPEWDSDDQKVQEKNFHGGYVQAMYRILDFYGDWMPYLKWQTFRGGWKSSTNAPRAETDEFEAGVEWQIMKELELTLAYSKMSRKELSTSRFGQAEGDLIRTQLQWNY